MNFLKKQYQDCFTFFKEIKKVMMLTVVIFIIIVVVSAVVLQQNPDVIYSMINDFMSMANESGIVNDAGNISSVHLFWNNLRACLMSISFGVIPFLFLPFISLITNAALIGATFGLYSMFGMPMTSLLAELIPHGIFEFPAILLSLSLGMYLCKEITMKILGKRKEKPIGETFAYVFQFFLCMIVPLLFIAGFVEAYITPIILNAFM